MESKIYFSVKWKKYYPVGTIPKSNRKSVERGKLDTPNIQVHVRAPSWLITNIIHMCHED
jgi:hypothetical protein